MQNGMPLGAQVVDAMSTARAAAGVFQNDAEVHRVSVSIWTQLGAWRHTSGFHRDNPRIQRMLHG
jgi:hypothetical protein